MTLIGGGYIGMEFAGMFARLGCEVHVIARQDLPLAPRFDEEVREDSLLSEHTVALAAGLGCWGHGGGEAAAVVPWRCMWWLGRTCHWLKI